MTEYLYKYTGTGTVTVHIKEKSYELSNTHPKLKDEIVLDRKLSEQELKDINCLELIEKDTKKKSDKGE